MFPRFPFDRMSELRSRVCHARKAMPRSTLGLVTCHRTERRWVSAREEFSRRHEEFSCGHVPSKAQGEGGRVLGMQVFRVLGRESITVKMISQGASKTNISLIVDDAEGPRAVTALHDEFFSS